MEKYFWREKNADKFVGRYEVIVPTKEELEKELILKFEQKLGRIDIIFDKNAREKYYREDKKPKEIKLEGLTEEEIQQKIGLNVVVDFLQVVYDFSKFKGVNFEILLSKNFKTPRKRSAEKIKSSIQKTIEDLKAKNNVNEALLQIYFSSRALAKLLKLDFGEVYKKQQEKQEVQGNFLNGKYVIFEEGI